MRTSIEVIVAIAGWLLGGPVGIGTVIIALLIGQIVHYSLPQCRKLLAKLAGAEEEQIMGMTQLTAKNDEIESKQVEFDQTIERTAVGSKN